MVAVVADEVDFAHDVVPILKNHCAECHTGPKPEGGFSISTQHLFFESGHVDRETPQKSRILELIRSADPEEQMPPADKPRLSERDVSLLTRWISQGAAWEPGFRFGKSAYEPPLLPREVVLPPPRKHGQNPIDRLLNTYFQARGLQPPEPVDDRQFLRRAYMDLLGLLPSIAEQKEFLKDKSPDRRRRVVNDLLDRNHNYAEHWISFWNDLLRNDYAGTGYIDGGRGQITAWLYEALVQNKRYDQFVTELIAPTEASNGFIKGIKWRGNVNASQVREVQFAQNVSQVFLGINMKCASCHDSFIDRWTLDEAYGLAAVYSERELVIHRCDKPTERVAKPAWIFPEIGQIDPAATQPERLKQLAALMTSPENGRFSRTIVNRLWHRLFGHGIVHPVDAMHTEPWNADLLDFLANYLVEHDYDLKSVLALIVTSDAYRGRPAAAQDSASADEYVFRGPIARHLTAEQFLDAVWQLTKSAPQKFDATLPETAYQSNQTPAVEPSGQWIWSYADVGQAPAGEEVTFRKQFTLTDRPRTASLIVTCDNEYSAHVNGQLVGADKNWPDVELFDISAHLREGNNEIVIHGRNAGSGPNAAALYAEIVMLPNGTEVANKTVNPTEVRRIATDRTWEVSADGRSEPKKDVEGATWLPAVPVKPQNFLGSGITTAIGTQLSAAISGSSRVVRASLLKSNMLMRSLGRPNREQVVTTRPPSLSTLQAIDLANGEYLDSLLATGARKRMAEASDRSEFIKTLFQEAICREPTPAELSLADAALGTELKADTVQDFLWLLVMLPDFQFVQ